jgi:3-dehydroquinate dehydratase
MGELGIFSRITCLLAGSFLTYSFIDQRVVSGQIDIKLLREIYQIISNANFLKNI